MVIKDKIHINFHQALLMIARALDYVGIDDAEHGQRVGHIAYECALKLGWNTDQALHAYYTGLIHDCGVSSSKEHLKLVTEMAPDDARHHCERGFNALSKCSVLTQFAEAIRYHHDAWPDLLAAPIDDATRDLAALIFLADRVDSIRARYCNNAHPELITLEVPQIQAELRKLSGSLFSPPMTDCMLKLVETDGFWFNLESPSPEELPIEEFTMMLSLRELTEIALFLANIVDAKSTFTYHHSTKVALLARQLAKDCGLSSDAQTMIYIAGLLHDVGKLRTPDEILHKPGGLSASEYALMRRHTVDTQHSLAAVFPHSDICQWAANHHERLDGSGYPHKKTAEALDKPSRIIAIIDIFQSLSQDRPYRDRWKLHEIVAKLDELVDNGKIDGQLVSVLKQRASSYYHLSVNDSLSNSLTIQ